MPYSCRKKNIDVLKNENYEYILGGRKKNETDEIKNKILSLKVEEGKPREISCPNGRLIISYSSKRAHNDKKDKEKGLKRLEKRVNSRKLSKKNINNRGYNKYLKLT